MARIRFRHVFLKRTKKVRCPQCGEVSFVPYYNKETFQPFEGNVFGKCDRLVKCGYFRKPLVEDYRRLGLDDGKEEIEVHPKAKTLIAEQEDGEFDELPSIYFIPSITGKIQETSLYKYLITIYPETKVLDVFRRYFVGYDKKWKGSPVFFQVDIDYKVRTGKVMGYSPETGKRIKIPYNHIAWFHTVDKKLRETVDTPPFKLAQCLYGEHLITQFTKFNVVESEKTAIISTLASEKQDELWLAVGGLENIQNRLFRVLEGRYVTFYPDKGKATKRWEAKVNSLDEDIRKNFKVNHCLEKVDWLEDGDDIADYILKTKNNENIKQ